MQTKFERSVSVKAVPLFSNGCSRSPSREQFLRGLTEGLFLLWPFVRFPFLFVASVWASQRRRLTFARSMISSPRPLRTAFIMNRLKPFACSRVIVGGIESS